MSAVHFDNSSVRVGGQPATALSLRFATVTEALRVWAKERSGQLAFRLLPDGRNRAIREITYGELWRLSAQAAAALIERGIRAGDRVVIVLPNGIDFLTAFFGSVIAGAIPVPAYPPFGLGRIDEYMERLRAICSSSDAVALCTTRTIAGIAAAVGDRRSAPRDIITPAALASENAIFDAPTSTAESTLFLQFTSGSTGRPKGVELTHGNVLANAHGIGLGVGISEGDVGCSWLPLCHDMGLIGCILTPLYWCLPVVIMSPQAFIGDPKRWLWAIHDYGATMSPAPNFAYDFCARRVADDDIEGLDLSSWRVALNGAEPVNLASLDAFVARFEKHGFRREALFPVYGLAEASLAVSFPKVGAPIAVDTVVADEFRSGGRALSCGEDADSSLFRTRLVSVGQPLWGTEVRITDEQGRSLPERHIGELLVRGPSVMRRYFNAPEETQAVLRDGWLHTGDLAYSAEGNLYIAGRIKDIIIKRGRNYHPHDFERAVDRIAGVRAGCVVAFSCISPPQGTGDQGSEQVILIVEAKDAEHLSDPGLRREIEEAAMAATGVRPDSVLLVPPNTIPKTTSGKLQRRLAKELYLRGRLVGRARARSAFSLVTAAISSAFQQARLAVRPVPTTNASNRAVGAGGE